MLLVDTSVWVDHLHRGNPAFRKRLVSSEVAIHPFIIGELACGSIKNRTEIFKLLGELPQAVVPENEEVITLIESRRLFGRGIGLIDAHLLCSALLSHMPLWTLDKRLGAAARYLKVSV